MALQWLSILVVVAVPIIDPQSDTAKADLAKLQGTWQVVSYEHDGVALPAEVLKKWPKLIIKGNDYSWSDGSRPGKLKLNAGTNPRHVDYTITEGDDKGLVEMAIYEIKGDTWKDCIAQDGKDRPRKFAAGKGSGCILVVYQRVK